MKILMLTVSTGNGHNSTAKRIKEKILQNNPSAEIEIVDIYKSYANKIKAWSMEQGYFLACNHLVGIYNYFFKKSEKSTYENRDKSKVNKEIYPLMYGILNKIYNFQPDLIICTYIFCAVAIANLKRYYTIPAKTLCMTLDYGISPYWECCANALDHMFLTDDYMIDVFKSKGYTDNQLLVTGIPVAEKFSNIIPKKEARKSVNLDEDLFTLIVMKASFFPISNQKLVNQFKLINDKIQIVIINGKDEKCKNDMTKRLAKANLKHNVVNLGFTDKIAEYFNSADLILGKAGGLSTTESINAEIPTLITNKLPQQEIYNKDFLVNHGCAISITSKNIAENINKLITDNELYNKLKESCKKVKKVGTLDKYYEIISKTPKADYTNLKLTDTKKQVIKNIDRKRKESILKQKNKLD